MMTQWLITASITLSGPSPTSDTPEHIKDAAIAAIKEGRVGGYSENAGILPLRVVLAVVEHELVSV